MARQYTFGPFLLDATRGTLLRDGVPIAIGRRALLLLTTLLDAAGESVRKDALLERAWPGAVVEESNLSVQVASLRRLLGAKPDGTEWIATIARLGYRLDGDVAVQEALVEAPPRAPRDAFDAGRPVIAVLPFVNLSDDPAQEYVVDGITEDVIAALTRFRWFRVVGRNTCFAFKARPIDAAGAAAELGVDYLVEGSLRKSGTRFRVAVELADARRRNCLFAERYDVAADDAFALQDAIVERIAGAIEPELLHSEGGLAVARRPSEAATAWNLVAQGAWHFHHVTEATHRRARELFRQAARVGPAIPEPWLWIGRVDAGLVAYGWSERPVEDLDEGLSAALRAVELDAKSPYAHYALAIVSVYREEFDVASQAAAESIELSPGFALGHLVLGMATLFAGDAHAAIEALERGIALNRHDPQNLVWYTLLAWACLFDQRPALAAAHAQQALRIRPLAAGALECMLAAQAVLGGSADRALGRDRLGNAPPASGAALRPMWRCNPAWAARRAGWLGASPPDA